MVARAFKFTNLSLEQRRKWFGLFISLPAVVTIFSTIFYPLLLGIVSSFQQVRLTQLSDTPWIGLDNYIKLFNDRYFWNALKNTAIFTTVWTFGAAIDGANAWQRFLYITLPSLKGVIVISTTLSVVWGFNFFDLIYTVSKGGPLSRSETFVILAQRMAFDQADVGYTAALGVVWLLLLLVASYTYLRQMKVMS